MQGSATACVVLVALVLASCRAAPSVNESETTFYDQRQKGDLNVHVHVKDVGILTIWGESIFGQYEEYDYNYDYQDPEDPDEEGGNKPNEEKPSTVASNSTTVMDAVTEMGDFSTSEELSVFTAESDNLTETTVTTMPESANVTNATTCNNSTSSTVAPLKIESSSTTIATTAEVVKETKKTSTTGDSKLTSSSSLPSTTTAATTVEMDKETKNTTQKTGDTAKPVLNDSTTALPIVAVLVPVQQQGGQKVHQGAGKRRCNPGYFRDSRGRCRRHRKPTYHTFQTLPIELPFGLRLSPRHAPRTESD
ncbi:uncharacterized protein [Periplaneta americana]|uniref:uncharacterized protein n=1 Tax=Periplaneta americana TaxID=6978 RepID=UPI0037E7AEC7